MSIPGGPCSATKTNGTPCLRKVSSCWYRTRGGDPRCRACYARERRCTQRVELKRARDDLEHAEAEAADEWALNDVYAIYGKRYVRTRPALRARSSVSLTRCHNARLSICRFGAQPDDWNERRYPLDETAKRVEYDTRRRARSHRGPGVSASRGSDRDRSGSSQPASQRLAAASQPANQPAGWLAGYGTPFVTDNRNKQPASQPAC